MKVVCFDVDGVLASFEQGFDAVVFNLVGEHTSTPWLTYGGHGGLAPDKISTAWDHIKQSPTFWANLPALVSLQTMWRINDLAATEIVYFVTHRMGIAPKQQTERWLWGNGIRQPAVVIAEAKDAVAKAVRATHFLEDHPENANAVAAVGTRSFLINCLSNQGATLNPSVTRVDSVEEFLHAVETDWLEREGTND